jgi:beta-glucosidase
VKKGSGLEVSVEVKNTGKTRSDEVAQLYLQRVSPSGTVHPLRRLIGFERLNGMEPGESRKAVFRVNPCDLEIYMESEGKKVIEPGTYRIYAGGNCLDERVSAEIEL